MARLHSDVASGNHSHVTITHRVVKTNTQHNEYMNHSHVTITHRVIKTNTQHNERMNIIPQSLYGSIDQEKIHSTIWWSGPHTWGLDDDSSEFRSYRIHFSSIHSGADWWVGLIKGGIDWGGSNSGPICPVHLYSHWAQMLWAANEGWKANTGKAKPHRQLCH